MHSAVISVIGGAKNFTMDGEKSDIFKKGYIKYIRLLTIQRVANDNAGLVKAALATNAWIITSGANIGVHKAVGEAVSEGSCSFVYAS